MVSESEQPVSITDESDDRIAVLEAENRRLRRDVARANRVKSRRGTLALGAAGTLALALGAVFPSSQSVLIAVGSTGIFAALLTYYISPRQYLPVSVGEGVYEALVETRDAMAHELGAADEQRYVPAERGEGVRLYVSRCESGHGNSTSAGSLTKTLGVDGSEAIALYPVGEALFERFERTVAGSLSDRPETLVKQISEGLVDHFELVNWIDEEVELSANRITLGVAGSRLGAVEHVDHPVASFVGVCVARGLNRPVTVQTTPTPDRNVDYVVTCSWEPDEGS